LKCCAFRRQNFQIKKKKAIHDELDGFLEAIGYDPAEREDLLRRIELILYPLSALRLLPDSIRDIRYDPRALEILSETFRQFAMSGASGLGGQLSGNSLLAADLALFLVRDPDAKGLAGLLGTGVHETVHWLALHGELPFDFSNEIITTAAGYGQFSQEFQRISFFEGHPATVGSAVPGDLSDRSQDGSSRRPQRPGSRTAGRSGRKMLRLVHSRGIPIPHEREKDAIRAFCGDLSGRLCDGLSQETKEF